jgi:glycerol-3-phosphate dehydrogenase
MTDTDRRDPADRTVALAAAAGDTFDLIVVGGGINGAGIARDAARRGLRTLLLERADYGFGTTWRSTKLIHGGLRYLEHGEFRLVFEGLRERAILLRTAPHLVRPLEFLVPVFRGGRYGTWTVRAGLVLYDLFALGRGLSHHHALSPAAVATLEPAVNRDGLAGGFSYYDAQVDLPERLCLENVLDAVRAGAYAFNHIEVTHLCVAGGRVAGVRARDAETGAEAEFRGRVIVNAAGPWVDRVLGRQAGRRLLGGTKGTHIVVDYRGAGPHRAIYAEAGADGRPFFIVPWRGRHLIGTTDVPFDGDPADVRPSPEELAYLRREARRVLPGAPLDDDAILYAFAGVRPLPYSMGRRAGAITRRHFIVAHDRDGYAGLLSIVGGKLTSYRRLAAETVDRVCRMLGTASRPSSTATMPLVPGPPPPVGDALARYLGTIYGPRALAVLKLARSDPALAAPLCPHGPDIAAQAVHAVRQEGARTVGDVLLRRTPAGWNACRGLDAAPAVARLLAADFGWSAAQTAAAVAAYRAEVDSALFPLASGATEPDRA